MEDRRLATLERAIDCGSVGTGDFFDGHLGIGQRLPGIASLRLQGVALSKPVGAAAEIT
jgi:hypothetical protein